MMDEKQMQLVDNVRIAVAQAKTQSEILEAAVELLDAFSDNFNWTGFYMMKDGHLEVGPYIGPETEHTRIELDSGICGAAAAQKESLIVDDVMSDPRFLACSLSTRSEIVVPLMDGDVCLGEIDIDSNTPSYFTKDDRVMLEAVAVEVVKRLGEVS